MSKVFDDTDDEESQDLGRRREKMCLLQEILRRSSLNSDCNLDVIEDDERDFLVDESLDFQKLSANQQQTIVFRWKSMSDVGLASLSLIPARCNS